MDENQQRNEGESQSQSRLEQPARIIPAGYLGPPAEIRI